MEAVIGFGANLGAREENIRLAISMLDGSGNTLARVSSFYETSPVGPQDQGWFINAAARIKTSLGPHELLRLCKDVEKRVGRPPDSPRWGPRIIDLDILIFGQSEVRSELLIIPHVELGNRLFALAPLAEIASDMAMPDGEPVSSFAARHIEALKDSGQRIAIIGANQQT